ncbi:hypothetical protein [Paenibacillus phytohabitans]|uniref:hypothetical protein n=1 Tax=Paenibacillus phytohabitans TaxID=2654978 RepID=UPI00149160CE|nr:hypothetical protein [Paenibacillus phytohabitans]
MKRFKSIVRSMWTGLKWAASRSWWFLKSPGVRKMLSQMVIVWGGEVIKHLLGL